MVEAILTAVLLLALPISSQAGENVSVSTKTAAVALDADTLDMVKAFLKMPTENLPARHVPRFLAVDPAALPEKLRQAFQAKKLELYALKQIADGKKHGSVRMPDDNCAAPKELQGNSAGILGMAGFAAINDDEERFLMEKTQCTESELMCEFTLQVVMERKGKKARGERRIFLHMKDPLMTLVGQYRQQGRVKQTNFFGLGTFAVCAPHGK